MSKEVLTLPALADMDSIAKALHSTHNGFPVMNTSGRMVGLVNRGVILKLIEGKNFYD